MPYSHKKSHNSHNSHNGHNNQITKDLKMRGYHKINYKSPAVAYPGASHAGTGPSKNPRVEKRRREMYLRP